MSRTVKHHGGVLARLIHAVAGFKAKHGTWPTSVLLDSGSIAPLSEDHLTPEGLASVQSKLSIKEGRDGSVSAADDAAQKMFDYSEAGLHYPVDIEEAYGWLGLDRPY